MTYWFFILPLANDSTDLLEDSLCLRAGELEHLTAIHQPHSKAALIFNKHLQINQFSLKSLSFPPPLPPLFLSPSLPHLTSLMSEMWCISFRLVGISNTFNISTREMTRPHPHTCSVTGICRATCLNIRKFTPLNSICQVSVCVYGDKIIIHLLLLTQEHQLLSRQEGNIRHIRSST